MTKETIDLLRSFIESEAAFGHPVRILAAKLKTEDDDNGAIGSAYIVEAHIINSRYKLLVNKAQMFAWRDRKQAIRLLDSSRDADD